MTKLLRIMVVGLALALLSSLMGGYDQVIWVLFAGAGLSALAFIGAIMGRHQTPVSTA